MSQATQPSFACTMINPIDGLIFGAISTIGTRIIGHVLDRAGISGDTTQDRIIKFALSFFGGAGIGCLAAFASGFPITFATALALTACQLGTVFVVSLIFSLRITSTFLKTIENQCLWPVLSFLYSDLNLDF